MISTVTLTHIVTTSIRAYGQAIVAIALSHVVGDSGEYQTVATLMRVLLSFRLILNIRPMAGIDYSILLD